MPAARPTLSVSELMPVLVWLTVTVETVGVVLVTLELVEELWAVLVEAGMGAGRIEVDVVLALAEVVLDVTVSRP